MINRRFGRDRPFVNHRILGLVLRAELSRVT